VTVPIPNSIGIKFKNGASGWRSHKSGFGKASTSGTVRNTKSQHESGTSPIIFIPPHSPDLLGAFS
jgi:hypothetical protein